MVKHESAKQKIRRARQLFAINAEALHRLDRNWSKLVVPEIANEFASLPEARDLDLFGQTSLFQLMNTTNTHCGHTMLVPVVDPSGGPR